VVRDHEDEDDKAKVSHQVMALQQRDGVTGAGQQTAWPWALSAVPAQVTGEVLALSGSLLSSTNEDDEDENEELKEMANENKRLMEECASLRKSSAQWEQVAGRLAKLARVQVAPGKNE
jgi:hypothetical protein